MDGWFQMVSSRSRGKCWLSIISLALTVAEERTKYRPRKVLNIGCQGSEYWGPRGGRGGGLTFR